MRHSDLEFARYKEPLANRKPKPMRADSAPIKTFLSALTGARIDLGHPVSKDQKTARSFAKAEVVGRVKAMSETGTVVGFDSLCLLKE